MGMSRYYLLGIIFVIFAMNVPEVNSNMGDKVRFYTPQIQAQLLVARDKAEPALTSILGDLSSKAQLVVLDNGKKVRVVTQPTSVDTSDNWSMSHANSLTADQFDAVLREYNSPAAGTGTFATQYAASKKIDNGYILYMFIRESTAGTAGSAWAGYKPGGSTHNTGNIKCWGGLPCYNGFVDYPSWEKGWEGHIDLLAYYRDQLGDRNIDMALERWAPSSENDQRSNCDEQKESYICGLKDNVGRWRNANKGNFIATSEKAGDKTMVQTANPLIPLPKDKIEYAFELTGCLQDTVPNALNPSPELQNISIPAGSDWSFNEHWNIVDPTSHICGVEYGGICDMATRYQLVAKNMGLQTIYERHAGGLAGVDYDDAVVIWSDGSRGGQDLIINNTTNKTANLRATLEGNTFKVVGWFS